MAKSLLIVESPSKAKTIKKYLGKDFDVTASVGHIKDLPKNKIGVDVEKDFEPEYVAIRGKSKIIKEIRAKAKDADTIYLAPDPDREGEAIAWHLAEIVQRANKKATVFRVMINEITRKGVTTAIAAPRELDKGRYESQQARRILDRLVGYTISPLLWDKVRRGLSAGRVQSVAVRLIVDREREIRAFNPEEYWTIQGLFESDHGPAFSARLHKVAGENPQLTQESQAAAVVQACEQGAYAITKVTRSSRKRNPKAAFTTSLLQQTAAQRLRFTAKKTMRVAQKLYEGVELGEDNSVGLITYMRTDSTRISDDALAACRDFILRVYGPEYLPETAREYKVKKSAQDAHEAIRPTSMDYPPEVVKPHLNREQFLLYRLIWRRFVACQMEAAVYDQTSIDIANGDALFRASGSILTFAGYLKVDQDSGPNKDSDLPDLSEGDPIACTQLDANQHFTQPPPRFSEATLVKELEDKGIGRPSTYASIISTIQDKDYVTKDSSGRFSPTELGTVVTDLLVESFPQILDAGFTAGMEERLDHIEEGDSDWVKVLGEFYDPFVKSVDEAREGMRNLKRESTPTDLDCPECSSKLVIKWGKNGYFLGCSSYPDCKHTSEFKTLDDGTIVPIQEEVVVAGQCDVCGKDMVVKAGRYGRFLACSGYPECKNTAPFTLDVCCPEDGGKLVEKRSRRGKTFFGCANYPDCSFAVWDEPVTIDCPTCHASYLLKPSRGGGYLKCNVCQDSWASEEEFLLAQAEDAGRPRRDDDESDAAVDDAEATSA